MRKLLLAAAMASPVSLLGSSVDIESKVELGSKTEVAKTLEIESSASDKRAELSESRKVNAPRLEVKSFSFTVPGSRVVLGDGVSTRYVRKILSVVAGKDSIVISVIDEVTGAWRQYVVKKKDLEREGKFATKKNDGARVALRAMDALAGSGAKKADASVIDLSVVDGSKVAVLLAPASKKDVETTAAALVSLLSSVKASLSGIYVAFMGVEESEEIKKAVETIRTGVGSAELLPLSAESVSKLQEKLAKASSLFNGNAAKDTSAFGRKVANELKKAKDLYTNPKKLAQVIVMETLKEIIWMPKKTLISSAKELTKTPIKRPSKEFSDWSKGKINTLEKKINENVWSKVFKEKDK